MAEDARMTFDELVEFIERRMKMSHIYQPLLIRSLLDAGGSASFRQLAQMFLVQDESQLLYYEKRIREMPYKVLQKHGVVGREGDLVRLSTPRLSLEQKARIRMLCEQRMQEFVQKRGIAIWDYRLLEADPIPDSVRYQVLKAAKGRCALCGATKDDVPLHVDHIKPRSKGGTNDIWNLQALCMDCNLAKSNDDDADLRNVVEGAPVAECRFCERIQRQDVLESLGGVVAIAGQSGVDTGHVLIVPKRHAVDYFSLSRQERVDADDLVRLMRNRIAQGDRSVRGFKLTVSCDDPATLGTAHAYVDLVADR